MGKTKNEERNAKSGSQGELRCRRHFLEMEAFSELAGSALTRPFRFSFFGFRFSPFLLFLALLWTGVGCGKPSDIPVIASGAEYTDLLSKAEGLSKDALAKYEAGQPLDEKDKKQLREAHDIFEGLIAFNPEGFGPYFGAAKIYDALGKPDLAAPYYQSFLQYGPPRPTADVQRLNAEAYYCLGIYFESQGEFEKVADAAEKAFRLYREPDYLALIASVRFRDGRIKEARDFVDEALAKQPGHPRATQLNALIEAAEKKAGK